MNNRALNREVANIAEPRCAVKRQRLIIGGYNIIDARATASREACVARKEDAGERRRSKTIAIQLA